MKRNLDNLHKKVVTLFNLLISSSFCILPALKSVGFFKLDET